MRSLRTRELQTAARALDDARRGKIAIEIDIADIDEEIRAQLDLLRGPAVPDGPVVASTLESAHFARSRARTRLDTLRSRRSGLTDELAVADERLEAAGVEVERAHRALRILEEA